MVLLEFDNSSAWWKTHLMGNYFSYDACDERKLYELYGEGFVSSSDRESCLAFAEKRARAVAPPRKRTTALERFRTGDRWSVWWACVAAVVLRITFLAWVSRPPEAELELAEGMGPMLLSSPSGALPPLHPSSHTHGSGYYRTERERGDRTSSPAPDDDGSGGEGRGRHKRNGSMGYISGDGGGISPSPGRRSQSRNSPGARSVKKFD